MCHLQLKVWPLEARAWKLKLLIHDNYFRIFLSEPEAVKEHYSNLLGDSVDILVSLTWYVLYCSLGGYSCSCIWVYMQDVQYLICIFNILPIHPWTHAHKHTCGLMSLVPLHVISLTVKDNFCRRKRSFKPCKSEHDSVKDHHRGKHTHTQKSSTCWVDPKIQVKVLLHVSTLRKSWPRKAKDRKRRTGSEMYKSRMLCVTFKSKNWQFCFLLF